MEPAPGSPDLPPSLRRPGRHAIVIGHRGASADVPENTLPAFEATWAAGAEWVEADTQPTSDRVQVIVHDDDVDRTTTGSGPVRGHTAAALAEFEVLGLPGTRIPTLQALLDRIGPGRALLLEIKGEQSAADIAEIIRLSTASGNDERVFLQSFEVPNLAHIRALAPARDFGLLVERLDDDPVARCRAVGANAYNPHYRDVLDTPRVVPILRAAGISVAVWTSDDPADWARLTRAGVDAIITNTPAELLAWQAERP
jgi:glycerophosphoryl diester phosphodiesterase